MERLPRLEGTIRAPDAVCANRRYGRLRTGRGRHPAIGAVLAMLAVLSVAFGAHARMDADVVVATELGTVNWTRGYIQAEAVRVPGVNTEIAQAAAQAEADARRKLVAVAYGIPVDAFRRVRDLDTEARLLLAGVRRLVGGTPIHKQQYLSDGTVRISLRLNLTGAFAQLVLPPGIRRIESIQTLKGKRKRPAAESPADRFAFTGLVVDARGTGLKPALVPGILDEDGRQVYGEMYASRESVVQWGMCRYFRDPEIARRSPRVADRPLVIPGLRAAGPGQTSIVINNSDARKIRSASEAITLLRNCRVVIVVD